MNKIAIVHDSFLHIGGAEKVLYNFIDKYPKADIYIPLLLDQYLNTLKTKGKIHRSLLSKLPFVNKYSSLLKPLIILYWEKLDLKKYDLIISSSHSFSSKSINKPINAKHVSYIHTPPRYLYREYNQMNWIKKFPFNYILWPFFSLLRKYDYYSAQKPDLLIANSINVQQRIKKYYNRDSVVIYPPHNQASHSFKKKKGKYFLFFSRLEKQKGAELVIKTCTKYNIPLVVIGKGSQEKYLKKIAGETVIFTGFVNKKQKENIFTHTKALIYASIDEDYGMVIPEIASYKIPIISYISEATKEEIQKKHINIVFEKHTVFELYKAIIKFNESLK